MTERMAAAIVNQRERQMTFLSGVAHDLRNPLAALAISASVVRSVDPLPPEALIRRTFETFRRQVALLDRMVGDLLDLASIEAGRLEVRTEDLDLRTVVRDVMDLFASSSARHEIQVSLPTTPIYVAGDAVRLAQVLTNLMTNGIRYSPGGGKVTISAEARDARATLKVIDEGVGIASDDVKRIFEPFNRLGDLRSGVGGKGLGLFIVQRIVEAHHGSVEVQSAPGRGATFSVHLNTIDHARSR
jgi:signal transduction histidine kinase